LERERVRLETLEGDVEGRGQEEKKGSPLYWKVCLSDSR